MRMILLALISLSFISFSVCDGANPQYLEAYYKKYPLSDLKKMALEGEAFIREKNNLFLLGGLHDYIDVLSLEEVSKIVANMVQENPELSDGKLENLADVNFHLTFLGLDEFLATFKLEKIQRVAYGVEAYLKKIRGQEDMTGGLLNVVPYLKTKEEVINIILSLVKDEKRLQDSRMLEYLGQHEISTQSELESFLAQKDKKFLVLMAVAAEKWERKVLNLKFMVGGIEAYVWSLSREEIIRIILTQAEKFPLVAGKGFLLRLISENKITTFPDFYKGIPSYIKDLKEGELDLIYNEHKAEADDANLNSLVENFSELDTESKREYIRNFVLSRGNHSEIETKSKIIRGGLENALSLIGDQILSDYCCATEVYFRDVNQITLFGGINDTVKTLTKQQKIEFILDKAEDLNELYTKGKLKEVLKQKGGCWRN